MNEYIVVAIFTLFSAIRSDPFAGGSSGHSGVVLLSIGVSRSHFYSSSIPSALAACTGYFLLRSLVIRSFLAANSSSLIPSADANSSFQVDFHRANP